MAKASLSVDDADLDSLTRRATPRRRPVGCGQRGTRLLQHLESMRSLLGQLGARWHQGQSKPAARAGSSQMQRRSSGVRQGPKSALEK